MNFQGPKTYHSIEEFEREEIRSGEKIGFSLDDLFQEATFNPAEDPSEEDEPEELDFD